MRPELERIAQELSALAGGAKPYVLPMPYARGHFRLYTQKELPESAAFTAQRQGDNLFVTVTDERLMQALKEMDEATPFVEAAPQESPFATLLYQILKKNWRAEAADEAQLIRMALDLDEDPLRCARVLENMETPLRKAYAQALRENRKHSVLTAVARQAVYYRKQLTFLSKETEDQI